MCVLNDEMIIEWAAAGGLTPFDPECVNPASVDLRWSGRWRLADVGGWGDEMSGDELVIQPLDFLLMDTIEYISIPNHLCADLMGKSTPARNGTEHLHAGFFDPGFGTKELSTGTLEIINVAPWPITVVRGQRLVQLKLQRMVAPPRRSYVLTGRYNGQRGPQPAR